MKTIEYYMNLPYKMEIIPDIEEGGYLCIVSGFVRVYNYRRYYRRGYSKYY